MSNEVDQESPVLGPQLVADPIRVLLLDDHSDNLLLRSTILRKYGYLTETASTVEEAEKLLDRIDIAVLDYHLGAGKFGTDVAAQLRKKVMAYYCMRVNHHMGQQRRVIPNDRTVADDGKGADMGVAPYAR